MTCYRGFQVKRAEQHLLEALYGHISSLGKFESDTLLEEDPDTMQRRAATRKVCLPTPSPRACLPQALLAACPKPSCLPALSPPVCLLQALLSAGPKPSCLPAPRPPTWLP